MRRALPVLFAVGIALVVWWLLDAPSTPSTSGTRVASESAPPAEVAGAPLEAVAATESVGERAALVAESADAMLAASAYPAASPCVVIGTVVDARGAPLSNLSVELAEFDPQVFAFDARPPSDAPDALTTTTDERGRFRFEWARLPGTTQRVDVMGGPHLSKGWKVLSSDNAFAERDGVREFDLGFIQLFDAGSIRGRVVDEGGAPIEGARIEPGESAGRWVGIRTTSAADGTYLLTNVPPGRYVVTAHCDRRRSAFVSDVDVETGRETSVDEFVLAPAATIEGVVRDRAGEPIEGASVTSWPTDAVPEEATHGLGDGSLWLPLMFDEHPYVSVATHEGQANFGRTQSSADGSFVLHVPEGAPHALVARHESFVDWDDRSARAQIVRSGARDVVIVMEALPTATIRVVDATTGAPIERFDVTVLHAFDQRLQHGTVPPLSTSMGSARPGGTATVHATSGAHVVDVSAEGYVTARCQVVVGSDPGAVRVVELAPSARLVGRALRDGTPVANAAVTLVGARKENADEQRALYKEAPLGDVPWYSTLWSSERRAHTDADGRFDVEIAHNGAALLVVDVGAGATLEHVIERVSTKTSRDVGDVHAVAPGRIEGTVVTVAGVTPSGLVVALDRGRNGRAALVDANGRFVFEDVPPGGRHLQLQHRRSELAFDEGRSIAVDSGATTTVTIDSTELTRGRVELILDRTAFGSDEGTTIALTEGRTSRSLGAPDANGRVSFEARAGIAMHATVWTPLGAVVLRDHVFNAVPLVTTRVTLSASFGSMAVEWPTNLVLPQHAELELELRPSPRSHVAQTVKVPLTHGVPAVDASSDVRMTNGRLEIDRILAGVWSVRATLWGRAADDTKSSVFSSTHTLTVLTGERAVIELK